MVVCLCDWPCLKKKHFRFARVFVATTISSILLALPTVFFFIFYLHSSHFPLLIIKNMTAIVGRIDAAADRIRDDELLADKKRVTHSFPPSTTPLTHASQFESFKLGGAPPALSSQSSRRHSHPRSHSRNVSVSVSVSFSSSFHDISLSSSYSSPNISSLSQPGPTAKRNSHHRRRSSVSTRRSSADVMGVALPTISTSNSEDNMSLGDKDSIRRRALWALEGKPNPDGFSPVEILELSTPEIERRISELRMFISIFFVPQLTPRHSEQAAFPPSMGNFTSGLSALANIRDSFSGRVTSSIKDQLHTLVEEEEEEPVASPPSALPSELPAAIGSPSPARHRPAGLHLCPFLLSPDRLMSAAAGELPTPESAATPTKPPGLMSLTLATSPSVISTSPASDGILSKGTDLHRRSVVPSHASASATFFRRASLTERTSSDPFEVPRKRSSISYKTSFHGLPTPELTRTTEGRPPIGSEIDWARHPSLTSEQHFRYQFQVALVARIRSSNALSLHVPKYVPCHSQLRQLFE
jgi:hypothetical protein